MHFPRHFYLSFVFHKNFPLLASRHAFQGKGKTRGSRQAAIFPVNPCQMKVDRVCMVLRGPPGEGGGYSHTLPIRVCAAQRGRDFEAPDLERGIHFGGVF